MQTAVDSSAHSLDAKLNPPSPGPAGLLRRELDAALRASRSARLIVFRAPAGFGKTSVMRQYREVLQRRGLRTAWLTLDRADNDMVRFLQGLVAALGSILPGLAEPPTDVGTLLRLVNRVNEHTVAFSLFLDEYEVLREPGVQTLVREIVANLPRSCQVVIGTRVAPHLGLGRLRARGQLVEIDSEQLRFSLEETLEYLTLCRGIRLDLVDVQLLHRKTEGWIAGLWLASAALHRSESKSEFIARFSGSNREVAEYLTEDVLNAQSREVRLFLLRTSLLRTLSPALCRALVPDVDCHRLLFDLESENVLITRIEGEERAYRYHSLFAGVLRAQLERESPEIIVGLHRAAAEWYMANDRPVPAIEHAIDAGDWAAATSLLERSALELAAAGRMRLLARWFDAIPAEALASHPHLRMTRVWALCFTRGPYQAMEALEHEHLQISAFPALRPHLLAIQPVLRGLMDRPHEAHALAMACLPDLPSGDRFADAALLAVLVDMCSARHQPGEALRMLDKLRSLGDGKVGLINTMHSEAAEGTIALYEGRLREATSRFRTAVSATSAPRGCFTQGNAWAGILYAGAIYESNDFEEATALLRVYLPLAREACMPDHVIMGYRMLARMAFSNGEVDTSFQLIGELESIGHERQLPRVVASARLERSRLQLLQRHASSSRDELARASEPSIWASFGTLRLPANELDYPALMRCRLEAVTGDCRAAVSALEAEVHVARATRREHRALKLELLLALALHRAGEIIAANARLDEALGKCRHEGFMRIALDEGLSMGLLVQSALERRQLDASIAKEDAHTGWLQQLLKAFGPLPAPLAGDNQTVPVDAYLSDPLTPKELRVLCLLSEGYSNQAIGDKLGISENTARTHLRAINSKLGVRSRLQAVSAGRAFGLLP